MSNPVAYDLDHLTRVARFERDRLRAQARRERIVRSAARAAVIERNAVLQSIAKAWLAEQRVIEDPVFKALAQFGGRITADYVRRDGRWRIAGDFTDLPRHLLRRPGHFDPHAVRVNGNIDQIAAAARMSVQDLKDFLIERPRRATYADALSFALDTYELQKAS